jgi:hypothetical protein
MIVNIYIVLRVVFQIHQATRMRRRTEEAARRRMRMDK